MLSTILMLIIFATATSDSNRDEIFSLPGLSYDINFRQYSGYLNATNERFLHYWFVESQRNPSEDPLLLWLNGGPGCSSIEGLLIELGPFRVATDGKTLFENPYAWNKVANVIFLEAPVGVGYSYSSNATYETDDDITSLDNYNALQHFFEKFPQFQKNDFYVTGESYAGIYIPTLSVRILNGSSGINFKGFAIGNGYVDAKKLNNSAFYFEYYHGLIGNDYWNLLVENCCNNSMDWRSCDFTSTTKECSHVAQNVFDFLNKTSFDWYNIYCESRNLSQSQQTPRQSGSRNEVPDSSFADKIRTTIPCKDLSDVQPWMNQGVVRDALHIPKFLPTWTSCNQHIFTTYTRLYDDMKSQILELLESRKLRGLIYNGDVDLVCNFLGDEWFVDDLKLEKISGWQPWTYNGQTAGFTKLFQNLTFLTVRGSGHMVPGDKPGPALKMISSFLSETPY